MVDNLAKYRGNAISKRPPSPAERRRSLVVHNVALTPEQNMKASISEAATFLRQRVHQLAKVMIIASPGFVTDRHLAKAHGFTRPSFAHRAPALERS